MKKAILLLTVFLLMGCSVNQTKEKAPKVYKDGTYKATVNGYGGDFEMNATFKDDKIKDIIVGENNETPSIGGVAIEQLITQMKEKQNEDIDVVTGATKTSQGMINAYKEILSDAKINNESKAQK